MITEDYVSFETAKLLKEKGIEYDQNESYWLIDADNKMYWVSRIGAYDYVDNPTDSFQRPKNGYRLVTQAVAMKWLREKRCIIVLNPTWFTSDGCKKWSFSVWADDNLEIDGEDQDKRIEFDSYEEACEAAIKYCLENLI